MFLGLLGIGIIFRKQWSENERFSFPLVVLPRLLIEEKEEGGRIVRPLYRKPVFRVGAANSLIFFAFLVLCRFSASRIRTECGAPWTYFTPYFPYLIFFLLGGLTVFPLETMLLTYAAGGFMAVAQFLLFAPTQMEMLHLAETEDASPRGVRWGLVLGVLGAILIGGYVVLVWNSGQGGDNIPVMKTGAWDRAGTSAA